MLTKNRLSCQALTEYLKQQNKVELLVCYMDLEEIRQLTEEQALTRASALVWRYKSQFEGARKPDTGNSKTKTSEMVVWECLGRLRYVDGGNIEGEHLLKMIQNSQNDLLSKLIIPFEGFLNSKEYKAWQNAHVEDEKRRQQSRAANQESSPRPCLSPSNSILGGMSVTSARQESVSAMYSNVLIVDDSLVTLKLARLTLEKDGHNVDKALNGQIALDMLKQSIYDVVLIDLNMPVMDGFETIRLFREYEQSHQRSLTAPIPKRSPRVGGGRSGAQDDDGNVSDLSDDEALMDDSPTTAAPKASRFALDPNNRAFGHGRGGSVGRGARADSSTRASFASSYETPSQLIIGMSTDVDSFTRRRALDSGMDYFLPKPFTLQKFTEIIRASIAAKDSRQNSPHLSADFSTSSIPTFNQNSLYSP